MGHVPIPLGDLLVRVPFGRMPLFVPTHEVLELALALATTEQVIQNAHALLPSFADSRRALGLALSQTAIDVQHEDRPDDGRDEAGPLVGPVEADHPAQQSR